MIPLVEQVYFNLLKGKSGRCIHVSLRDECIRFLNKYKTTNLITIRDNKRLHLPQKKIT